MMIVPNSALPDYFKCLLGILKVDAHYKLPNSQNEVELVERDKGGNPNTLSRIWITNLPQNSMVLRAGSLTYSVIEDCPRTGIWHKVANYRHVSDYIVIAEYRKKFYHLYIEMKTGCKSGKYIAQLRCAQGQMVHLQYLISKFDPSVLNLPVESRFVKLSKTLAMKSLTTGMSTFPIPNPPACNNDPTQAYQCFAEEGAKISFDKLLLP